MHADQFLRIAGVLHVGLIIATALLPRTVNLATNLRGLPQFVRRLVWVYYTLTSVLIVGFGALTFTYAHALASDWPPSRALCAILALFWGVRLVAALCLFDVRPYLTSRYHIVGHFATTVTFAYLVAVYASVALGMWHA